MRWLIFVVALVSSGCGSESPMAPTAAANLTTSGSLTVTGCLPSTGNLFSCANFAGVATNAATGCAANVRGVTTTYDVTTRVQVGTAAWSYGTKVRAGEQISYAGTSLLLTGPLTGGWYYATTVSWDNVTCF